MRLDSISISRFRSIEAASLPNCSQFNLLIGKNNAGKSNILAAIKVFFSTLAQEQFVVIDREQNILDFNQKNHKTPIEISMTFIVNDQERQELTKCIVETAPQMKNAVDSFPTKILLTVVLAIRMSSGLTVSFVRSISVSALNNMQFHQPLLTVNEKTAAEIIDNYIKAQNKEREMEELKSAMSRFDRISSEEWSRMRSEGDILRVTRVMVMRPGDEISSATWLRLQPIMEKNNALPDFKSAVKALIAATSQEVSQLRQARLVNKLNSFTGEDESIPPYVDHVIKSVGAIRTLYLTERREPIGQAEAARILDLKTRRGGEEKLRIIRATVSALLGVDIDAFKSELAGPRSGREIAELDVDKFLVQANGSGIREALRLILDYEFQKPSILLVEEPEIHLHPALETSMLQYLRRISEESQVFTTTHSTNFIENSDAQTIYLVAKAPTTKITVLSYDSAESQLPRELGIRLSSLFMYDRIAFVEGRTDEEVLREIATKLNVNLAQANVGFIIMDGVRNFGNFAAEKTLAFLTKRRVKMWFILDKDERDDDEIKKMKERLKDQAELTVLSKREIENYLLVPDTIMQFIEFKQTSGGGEFPKKPSVVEIERLLDVKCNELKQEAIIRRVLRRVAQPNFFNRKAVLDGAINDALQNLQAELSRMESLIQSHKGSVQRIYEEEQASVEAQWMPHRMNLVPGDILIDQVCQEFGIRYRKERDASRLASFLSTDSIDLELRKLIRSLSDP